MANRFQRRRVVKIPVFMYGITLLICVFAVFELYRWVVPFHSQNPLFHEVTIGESVISEWKYGGQDEEGYLKFYNGQQTVVLPPSTRMFDADGKFVVLEHYTPSSLTYAEPLEALPFTWVAALFGAAGFFLILVYFKMKNNRRMLRMKKRSLKLRNAEGMQNLARAVKVDSRPKRFQAARKSKWKSR